MITDYLKQIDWQEQKTKIVAGTVILVVAALYLYSDYKERREIREHNAKLYQKYLEVKKDYRLLKTYVKSFESSRWQEAVLNVQTQTQMVDIDLIEFEKLLNKTPLLERPKGENEE